MSYSNATKVRDRTGFTEDEIDDRSLSILVDKAAKKVKNELNVKRTNVELEQVDNGVYRLPNTPVADTNFDKQVDKTDLTIYNWIDKDDSSTKQETTINFLDTQTGRIEIDDSNAEKVTADYSYYLGKTTPNWELIEEATSYLAGFLAVNKVRGREPASVRMGAMNIRDSNPGSNFKDIYRETINQIKNNMSA